MSKSQPNHKRRETIKDEKLRRDLYAAGYLPAIGGWKARVRLPRVERLYQYGLELKAVGRGYVLLDRRTGFAAVGPLPRAIDAIAVGESMIESGALHIILPSEVHRDFVPETLQELEAADGLVGDGRQILS